MRHQQNREKIMFKSSRERTYTIGKIEPHILRRRRRSRKWAKERATIGRSSVVSFSRLSMRFADYTAPSSHGDAGGYSSQTLDPASYPLPARIPRVLASRSSNRDGGCGSLQLKLNARALLVNDSWRSYYRGPGLARSDTSNFQR